MVFFTIFSFVLITDKFIYEELEDFTINNKIWVRRLWTLTVLCNVFLMYKFVSETLNVKFVFLNFYFYYKCIF